MIKRSNLSIHRVEGGTEIQTKGMSYLLNEIIPEKIPTLFNVTYTHIQEAF
jgi:hypothetical protein